MVARGLRLALGLALAVLAVPAHAGDPIRIDQAWARPLPETSVNGAVYFTIVNHGHHGDRLVAASVPVADRAELHNHVPRDGLLVMEAQEAVDVPAGGQVAFAPGGLHVMMLGLTRPMTRGTGFPLTLTFERAGTVTVPVRVMDPPAGNGASGHGTGSQSHGHGTSGH